MRVHITYVQTDRVLSIRAYVIRRDSTNKPIKINRVPIGNRVLPGGCGGGGRPTPSELIAINHNVTRVYLLCVPPSGGGGGS